MSGERTSPQPAAPEERATRARAEEPLPGRVSAAAALTRLSQRPRPADVLSLQRTIGNRAVVQLLAQQAAPPVGSRVRVTEPSPALTAAHTEQAFERATRGGPSPLPHREEMETAFGQDFGGVAAFVGQAAALRGTQSEAAARGERVVFADARPTRRQVAHELAHVAQARREPPGDALVSERHDASEVEAEALAERVAAGGRAEALARPSAQIQLERARVIDPRNPLVGQVFEVVGASSNGQVYVRTPDGDVWLEPGTFERIPDEQGSSQQQSTAFSNQSASAMSSSASGYEDAQEQVEPLEAFRVLVQADFMSGDRYGIASALTLQPDLGVIILTTERTRAAAEDLARFYRDVVASAAAKDFAIAQQSAQSSKKRKASQPVLDQRRRIGVHVVPDAHEAYRNREELREDRTFADLLGDAEMVSATYGTQIIADQLAEYGTEGEGGVPAYLAQSWLGEPGAKEQSDEHDAKTAMLLDWMLSKGLKPGRYAFIWVKTGDPNAEKAHHFTSPVGAAQMARMAAKLGRTPVLIGDPLRISAPLPEQTIFLGPFWSDRTFPFANEGRLGQLRLYRFLATHEGYDAVNIGMRSGALEGPALMGMPTVYLEEEGNAQAQRMEKWLRTMPNYHRIILRSVPGGPQRRYLRQVILDTMRRVDREQPSVTSGGMFVDGVVPLDQKKAYLEYLGQQAAYLEFISEIGGSQEGFEVGDLTNVGDMLDRSKEALTSSGSDNETEPALGPSNPSYAQRFLASLGKKSSSDQSSSDQSSSDSSSSDKSSGSSSKSSQHGKKLPMLAPERPLVIRNPMAWQPIAPVVSTAQLDARLNEGEAIDAIMTMVGRQFVAYLDTINRTVRDENGREENSDAKAVRAQQVRAFAEAAEGHQQLAIASLGLGTTQPGAVRDKWAAAYTASRGSSGDSHETRVAFLNALLVLIRRAYLAALDNLIPPHRAFA